MLSLGVYAIDVTDLIREFQIKRMQKPIGEKAFVPRTCEIFSFDRRYCRGIEWWEEKKICEKASCTANSRL